MNILKEGVDINAFVDLFYVINSKEGTGESSVIGLQVYTKVSDNQIQIEDFDFPENSAYDSALVSCFIYFIIEVL